LYGFGNWPDVADHVGTKTDDECTEHYFQLYVEPNNRLPIPLGKHPAQQPLSSIIMKEYARKKKTHKKAQPSNPIKVRTYV